MEPDLSKYLAAAIAQGNDLDALLQRADSLQEKRLYARDRVLHYLHDAVVFVQGQYTTQSLVFNVPNGNDFEAARMMMLPEVRMISLAESTDGPSDLVYRPTTWFCTGTAIDVAASIDALFEMNYVGEDGEKRQYQNAAFFAAQMFSAPLNINMTVGSGSQNPIPTNSANQYPSGRVFEPFLRLKAGSSMLVQVTPTYSGLRGPTGGGEPDSRIYEYRIRGVLEGYKRVRR